MSIKLLDCPFCGNEAGIETFTTAAEKVPRYRVKCSKCFCETNWDFFSVEDVVAAWNKRPGWTTDGQPYICSCTECGATVQEGDKYCHECGAMIDWEWK